MSSATMNVHAAVMARSRPGLAGECCDRRDSQCVRLWGSYLLGTLLTLPLGSRKQPWTGQDGGARPDSRSVQDSGI